MEAQLEVPWSGLSPPRSQTSAAPEPLEGVWKHRCPPPGVLIRWVWAGPENVHLQQVPRCHHGCGPSGHVLRRVSCLRRTAPPFPGQLCCHLRLVPAPRLPGARVLLDGLERRCPSAAVAFATCAVPCDQLQGASFCHPGFTQPGEVKLFPWGPRQANDLSG